MHARPYVMVVLGTTIHEFTGDHPVARMETRGWSDQVRPWRIGVDAERSGDTSL